MQIMPDMVRGTLTEEERQRRWQQLADLYLAQQASCYPPDYLRTRPSVDRLLETMETNLPPGPPFFPPDSLTDLAGGACFNDARVEVERARTEQVLSQYELVVLNAFREVEDALVAVETFRTEHEIRLRQVETAGQALEAELRRIAQAQLYRERSDHTLTPTALVNEAYLKLFREGCGWNDQNHFLSSAATAMRHVLVDHARHRDTAKRGGGILRIPLDDVLREPSDQDPELTALDDALQELAELDERQAKIIEMRYFAGLTIEEVAKVLDVSPSTEAPWPAPVSTGVEVIGV